MIAFNTSLFTPLIQFLAVDNIYDSIYAKQASNYLSLYEKLDTTFDLEQFSNEEIIQLVYQLTLENYDNVSYQQLNPYLYDTNVAFGEGGVCMNKADFLAKILSNLPNSEAYIIDGNVYHNEIVDDDNEQRHSITLWNYAPNKGKQYTIFLDPTWDTFGYYNPATKRIELFHESEEDNDVEIFIPDNLQGSSSIINRFYVNDYYNTYSNLSDNKNEIDKLFEQKQCRSATVNKYKELFRKKLLNNDPVDLINLEILIACLDEGEIFEFQNPNVLQNIYKQYTNYQNDLNDHHISKVKRVDGSDEPVKSGKYAIENFFRDLGKYFDSHPVSENKFKSGQQAPIIIQRYDKKFYITNSVEFNASYNDIIQYKIKQEKSEKNFEFGIAIDLVYKNYPDITDFKHIPEKYIQDFTEEIINNRGILEYLDKSEIELFIKNTDGTYRENFENTKNEMDNAIEDYISQQPLDGLDVANYFESKYYKYHPPSRDAR